MLLSAMLAVVKSAVDLFCAGLLVSLIVFHQTSSSKNSFISCENKIKK
jgi:hypothetical protein